MDLLRGLKLNCLLVPWALAVVAAAVLAWGLQRAEERATTLGRQALVAELAAYAAFESAANRPPLDQALNADKRWKCLAELKLDKDQVAVARRAGTPPALDLQAPPHQLWLVVDTPQWWPIEGDHLAVAVGLRDPAGRIGGILYGQIQDPRLDLSGELILAFLALVLTALLLGWYLSRRIYRPVEALAEQARAALEGQAAPPQDTHSAETAVLRSSLMGLIERYRSTSGKTPGVQPTQPAARPGDPPTGA